jgi:hypothetical protein
MKKLVSLLAVSVFILTGSAVVFAAEKAPPKVLDLANSKLAAFGTDPVIVKAVKLENAKGKSLSQIKSMDKKWRATPGIVDYMQRLMDSECGRYLAEIQNGSPFFAEIFVMDNQGANVAMTDKTSDYWQGDEAKFKKSFNGGSGEVFVDDVEFDDSTQAYLVQVSVPVKDDGRVIGAITFGIDVDQIE